MESNIEKKIRLLGSPIGKIKEKTHYFRKQAPLIVNPGFRCIHQNKYFEDYYFKCCKKNYFCTACHDDGCHDKYTKPIQYCGFCKNETKREDKEICQVCLRNIAVDKETFGKREYRNDLDFLLEKEPTEEKNTKKKFLCQHKNNFFGYYSFKCCADKKYPCKICHDLKETHEGINIIKLLCGYCQRNVPKGVDKYQRNSCNCKKNLLITKGLFWEGGKGCVDKILLNNDCSHKYHGKNKTISKKQQVNK